MKRRTVIQRNKEGMALLVVTLFLVVAAIALTALTTRSLNQTKAIDQFATYKQCFDGMAAGIAESIVELEKSEDGIIGAEYWQPDGELQVPNFDAQGVIPKSLSTRPSTEYFAYAQQWDSDGLDNNGDGLVDNPEELGFVTVYSFARDEGVVRRAEVVIEGADVNVWNNAIFAGAGAAGAVINGNVSIHGSVHILGDNVVAGGEALTVLELSGASLIHNNYGDSTVFTDRLRHSVPAPPQVLLGGETVDSLGAKFRVKRGLVSLNGSSEIGEVNLTGNTDKETLDAIYNEDGWTGNSVTDDGDRGDPTTVFSDNGWDTAYDLGSKVSFPLLSDDWRWPENVGCHEYEGVAGAPGATEDNDLGEPYEHAEFYLDNLSDGDPYAGNVVIDTSQDFYLNLTRPADANPDNRVKDDPDACVKGDDYLYYDAANDVLEINGQVAIDGALEFTGKGKDDTVYYTGRGTVLVRDDVIMNTNLLACNDGDPNNYVGSFPEKNIVGIMSANNIIMGTSSQLELMGAFYAQDTITSTKQTVVMGTYVANYFDMGSQVPDIYQVPDLAKNLPIGMIGNWPLRVYSQVSWREL